MRIIYKIKDVLGMSRAMNAASSAAAAAHPSPSACPVGGHGMDLPQSRSSSSIHTLPPGQWPTEGPKPSKCAIVMYYISIILTIIGTIMVIRSAIFLEENEKPIALGVGLCLATGGIAMIAITNVINRLEHEKIMNYLDMKVEELRYHENFRKMPNQHEAMSYLVPSEESMA